MFQNNWSLFGSNFFFWHRENIDFHRYCSGKVAK
jgi:hypothetical protein